MRVWKRKLVGALLWLFILFACSLSVRSEPQRAPSEKFNLSFEVADFESAQVDIRWTSEASAAPVRTRSFIERKKGQFVQDGRLIEATTLEALGKGFQRLVPVRGLQTCNAAAADVQSPEISAPRIEVEVWTRSRGRLKLRSESTCAEMLPWNVTDGSRLFASYDPAVGRALHDWVRPVCVSCPWAKTPAPAPALFEREEITFEKTFQALLSEWKRLGEAGKSSLWVGVQTEHLSSALEWMDARRFLLRLRQVADQKKNPPPVRSRAVDLLKQLRLREPLQTLP